jgi:hypothetical protein
MTVNTVPVDLTMKHESEWRAIRVIAVRGAEGATLGARQNPIVSSKASQERVSS